MYKMMERKGRRDIEDMIKYETFNTLKIII